MKDAPLRQRLRSANDASTYAGFAFSAQGRKDAPPLVDDGTTDCQHRSGTPQHGPHASRHAVHPPNAQVFVVGTEILTRRLTHCQSQKHHRGNCTLLVPRETTASNPFCRTSVLGWISGRFGLGPRDARSVTLFPGGSARDLPSNGHVPVRHLDFPIPYR